MTKLLDRELPEAYAGQIQAAYTSAIAARDGGTDTPPGQMSRFLSLVVAARDAGWSIESVGSLVGVTGRWLRKLLESHPTEPALNPVFPAGPLLRGHLSVEQAKELRRLAPLARAGRAHNRDVSTREASDQFTALLVQHRERKVSWPELSAATGPWKSWPPARLAPGTVSSSGLVARVNRK